MAGRSRGVSPGDAIGLALERTLKKELSDKKHNHKKKKGKEVTFQEPGSPQQRIVFTGTLIRGVQPDQHSFTVLAGESSPTITGGFGQWAELERPQTESLQVLTHYSTLTMTVPIIFDAVTADVVDVANGRPNSAGNLIEEDISVLEWMGGRGGLTQGEPNGVTPLVRVYSVNNAGKEHPLIPPNAQGIKWVVSNIEFDPNPIRNQGGFRLRQEVTVELKKYVERPGDSSADGPAAKARARKADQGHIIVHAKEGLDTVQQIASHVVKEPRAAHKIVAYNIRYNHKWRHGVSTEKHLRLGTEVWVPKSVADGLGWPS